MRHLLVVILCTLSLVGCSFHNEQNDLADNHYYVVKRHADPLANYVGDWSINSKNWLKKLIINKDGSIKIVLHPEYGVIDGKVFIDDDRPHIILRDGAKAEIVSVEQESLRIETYGKQEQLTSMRR